MANKLSALPILQARRGRRAAATAFALVVAGAWQPTLLPAQIEVEVLTSGTAAHTPAAAAPTPSSKDMEPDAAANKIVPAPGTVLQSTQNSSLGSGTTVAPAPSLNLSQDQLVLKEGESTETVAVRSGAELLKMLGLQTKSAEKKKEVPGELDEDTTNSLFDVSAVERLKGADPTVVYRVVVQDTPLPDPMIVPWIRQAKLLQERFDKAVEMLGNNRVVEGRQELLAIATDFPDSDYAVQSRELLKKLEDLTNQPMPQPIVKTEEATTVTVELSPNIQVGTVIIDSADPTGNRVMINRQSYKVGDTIKGVPGHHLTGINENAVQIEVEQSGLKKTFDIPVRPTGMNQ